MKVSLPFFKHISKQMLFGLLLMLVFSGYSQASMELQEPRAFQEGEWFKFRIHYGLVTAGYATMKVESSTYNNTPVFHLKGFGETTGLSRFFFKVEDYYESLVDKETNLPYKFIRKIDEGGHTKDKTIEFDQHNQKAHIHNRKKDIRTTLDTDPNVHDMISSFYYLRNFLDTQDIKIGDEAKLTMFFDEENYPFKLRFLGRETIRAKFGKVSCLKFRPLVLAGRVFKEQESLTIWVSDDDNKIPIRIRASLAVGSIKADLVEFKGLKN